MNRIENAGRKIIKPKKAISEDDRFMATFLDSEGNRMALHSLK
ncbi:MAG: VOC family protein [Fidelibacterota bacterium]